MKAGDGPELTAFDRVLNRALARGVAFQLEVLLFKKAMITLDAVVYDLHPKVTRQKYLTKKIILRLLVEFPKRVVMLPWPRSRKYKSRISNAEFFAMLGHVIARPFR